MHLCFDCGHSLKFITKPGRMYWYDGYWCEFPKNYGLSTCKECGWTFEELKLPWFIIQEFDRQIVNPNSSRLLTLAWYQKKLLKQVANYDNQSTFWETLILLLAARELYLNKGKQDATKPLQRFFKPYQEVAWGMESSEAQELITVAIKAWTFGYKA